MAYLKELDTRCACGERAEVAVYSCRDDDLGVFCRRCGKKVLAEQERREAAWSDCSGYAEIGA